MIRTVAALLALVGSEAIAREPAGLDRALTELTRQGRFSGAVVIRDAEGVSFAKGYGLADPYSGRAFTPDTPADSGSLAKPVTAASILALVRDGKLDLDSAAIRYLPQLPFGDITVRQLLSHSAGLPLDESEAGLAGKTNLQLVEAARGTVLLFKPGTRFSYCNLCTVALAEIVERVSGQHYLQFARSRLNLPSGITIRPARLADWPGRAIGYRRTPLGRIERADSYEGEAFYGPANFSLSASQLAEWGSRWWQAPLAALRSPATQPALINGRRSGLTLGNWYCAADRQRCHYTGHHEGFHHILYWDAAKRRAIALVSNNTLAPSLQQRLQRAVVAFAEGRPAQARREIALAGPGSPAAPGRYRLGGEIVGVSAGSGPLLKVSRRGLAYTAFPVGEGWHYVPGLDVYVAGGGGLRWLSLYEDRLAVADKAS